MAKRQAQAPNTNTQTADDDDDDAPGFVTVEQLNAAISGKLKDFVEKKLPKMLEGQFSSLSATLLEGFRGQGTSQQEQTPANGTPANNQQSNPELVRLAKENETTKAALTRLTEDRAREQAAAKRDKARIMLEASLTAARVHPRLLPGAVKVLEENLTEDEGRIVFKRQNAYGLDELVTVEDAVKAWAKSEDGKAFVMAPTTKGTGAGPRAQAPQTRQAPKGKPATKDEQVDDTKRAEREALNILAEEFLGMGSSSDDD